MPLMGGFGRGSQAPFKPPRPLSANTQVTPSTSQVGRLADVSAGRQQQAHGTSSESEDSQQDDEIRDSDGSESQAQAQAPAKATTALPSKTKIPAELLTLLLHENFKRDDTRSTADAIALLEKYIDTFVREAIARAVSEREQANPGGHDGFLEVLDLERLAPQLIMDF